MSFFINVNRSFAHIFTNLCLNLQGLPTNKQKIVDDFQLDHLPSHLLIDPEGKISQFPALPPSPLSKGYNSTTIDKTFFIIKKNTTLKESFKIGKKD